MRIKSTFAVYFRVYLGSRIILSTARIDVGNTAAIAEAREALTVLTDNGYDVKRVAVKK